MTLTDADRHEIDELTELYQQAKQDYADALKALDDAEGDYVEVAVYKVNAALAQLNAIHKEMKKI